jgi:PAS domain S-box-containing protein
MNEPAGPSPSHGGPFPAGPSSAGPSSAGPFPSGGGRTGALIRARDWSATPLGPVADWPQSLRTALGICLDCTFPILIWWGPSLVKLYNDAYADIIADKHPGALGGAGREVWPDIWDTIGPMLTQVMTTGQAAPAEDMCLVLDRRGYPEESYFSFSYSPIRDETGGVGGVFCPVIETTRRVLGERRLAFLLDLERHLRDIATPDAVKAFVSGRLGPHLGAAQAGYADVDATTEYLEVVNDWNDGRLASMSGRHVLDSFGKPRADALRAGQALAIGDVRAHGLTAAPPIQAAYASRSVRAILNVPLIKAGRLVAILYALDAQPRIWSEAQISLMADVAERVWSCVERIRAEIASREQKAQLAAVIRTVPAAVWFTQTPTVGFVTGNRMAAEMLRFPDEANMSLASWSEQQPLHVRVLRHGAQVPAGALPLQRAARGEPVLPEELELRFTDGTSVHMLVQATSLRDAAGRITGAVCAAVDITARKQAEAALRESEEEYRALADNLPNLCWMAHADGGIYWYNRRWHDYTGTRPGENHGWRWESVHHPDVLPAVVARWKTSLATGTAFEMTFPLRAADGSFRPFLTRVVPVRDAAGVITRWFGSNVDISELQRTETALRESEAALRGIADAMPGAVWTASPEGGLTYAGQTWLDYAGTTIEETLGDGWARFVHPDDLERVAAAWGASLRSGGLYSVEFRLRRHDGEYEWFLVRAAPVRDGDGVITRWTGVNVSIREQRQSQDALRRLNESLEQRVREEVARREQAQSRLAHSQRMEALGQLAGGIAHDFNNVLQAVSGGLSLIQRRAHDAGVVRQLAGMAADAAARGAAITGRLLAFARKGELRTVAIAPAPLLADLREILAHTLGSAIAVHLLVGPDCPDLLADRAQLETVLVNLAVNARDAMPGGGELTVSAACERVEDSLTHPAGLAAAEYVRLTLADTGHGMDAATLMRASEPFFTTKPVGQGTGLGLAMARGFAQQSGGGFAIASTVGRGTQVTLWFPRSAAASVAGGEAGDAVPALPAAAAPRVLVVDDDTLVREVVTGHLRDRGYTTIQASDGLSALARLDAGETPDLMVTDLSMPGMNGLVLIEEARKRRPGLPIVLLTGYADAGLQVGVPGGVPGGVDGGAGEARVVVLRKPVTGEELARQAAALLGAAI